MLTFDSNVLIHARDLGEPKRGPVARHLLLAAPRVASFITQQALGEFCNVTYRKHLLTAAEIREQVDNWMIFYPILRTSPYQLLDAAELAERRRKQFWDMVIVRVAADAGATVLLTEDIGDGEVIEGVRILNPYLDKNEEQLARLLTPAI